MKLIIALGNIGKQYERTRHNLGFILGDRLIDQYGLRHSSSKFDSEVFLGEIAGNRVVLIKPNTLMNLSGNAARKALDFFKIELPDTYVLHDDLDLDLGRVKIKVGGGSGGHNGVKSIDQNLGTDYVRIRLGIAGEDYSEKFDAANYVLGKFNSREMGRVDEFTAQVAKEFPLVIAGDFNNFLNSYTNAILTS